MSDELPPDKAYLRAEDGVRIMDLTARVKKLEDAILDIDAHAVALDEDADGFVSKGYIISIGSLHRALGIIGHTAPKKAWNVPKVVLAPESEPDGTDVDG